MSLQQIAWPAVIKIYYSMIFNCAANKAAYTFVHFSAFTKSLPLRVKAMSVNPVRWLKQEKRLNRDPHGESLYWAVLILRDQEPG